MKQFYGFGTLDEMRAALSERTVTALLAGKVRRTDLTVCSPDKGRCRGHHVFGDELKFVYDDGEPDYGHVESMCTVEYNGDTYAWTEHKEIQCSSNASETTPTKNAAPTPTSSSSEDRSASGG